MSEDECLEVVEAIEASDDLRRRVAAAIEAVIGGTQDETKRRAISEMHKAFADFAQNYYGILHDLKAGIRAARDLANARGGTEKGQRGGTGEDCSCGNEETDSKAKD